MPTVIGSLQRFWRSIARRSCTVRLTGSNGGYVGLEFEAGGDPCELRSQSIHRFYVLQQRPEGIQNLLAEAYCDGLNVLFDDGQGGTKYFRVVQAALKRNSKPFKYYSPMMRVANRANPARQANQANVEVVVTFHSTLGQIRQSARADLTYSLNLR